MKRNNSEDTPVAAVRAGGCDDATWRVHGQSVAALVEVAWMVNGLPPDRHALRFLSRESREPLLPPTCRDRFPWTAVYGPACLEWTRRATALDRARIGP